MLKYLVNKFKDNKIVIFFFAVIFSSYNSPFLFLLNYSELNIFNIFVIYQYITPLVIFFCLLFYAYKLNFFYVFFSKKNLTLKLLLFINCVTIFGIFFNDLSYFYPVHEVSSQSLDKVLLDWKSSYTRLIFVINNLNIIFFSFICLKEGRLKFILSFIMGILFIISFYYIFNILYDYINVDQVIYFYESGKLALGSSTLNFVNPRSSGLARTVLLISIFFLLFFLFYKSENIFYNKFFKFIILFLVVFLNFLIIHLQSRVSIYFLYLFLLFLIFFNIFAKLHKIKKFIFIILFIFILPFFLSIIFTEYKKAKIIDSSKVIIDHSQFDTRIFHRTTSGRTDLWVKAIKSYNKIPALGYGVLGDRFAYSFSVSNIFLYFLISGGLIGFFTIILFNIHLVKNIIALLISRKLFNNSEPFFHISFIFILFFLFRSLVENSYGQFSIDFMIFVPACLIFENYLRQYKIIS
jgi:O-antigen ligase